MAALFQKYDPRTDYVNPTISAMTDTGLTNYMFKSRNPHLGMKEPQNFAKEKKLEMQHFYLPLMFMTFGFILAMISAVSEKCKKNNYSSKADHRTLVKQIPCKALPF